MFRPPGFQPAAIPLHGNILVPFEPAGQQMIGQYILFKWPTYGWCQARAVCTLPPGLGCRA